METTSIPENLKVYRKKWLTALGGVIFLIIAAALAGIFIFAYMQTDEATIRDIKSELIISFVGIDICSLILIIYAVLCFNNLRYPLILATDEKGIYDYSGFVHGGFINWNDIRQITGSRLIENILDVFNDNTPPHVKIELKNYKRTFANRSGLWRTLFFLSGYGCVRIRTFCSPLSRRNTLKLLNERLTYYTETDK